MNGHIQGDVPKIILPGSPLYGQARQVYNRAIQKFPAAIVYCHDEREVTEAVLFAKRHGYTVRIRSGGHNYEGFCVGNGVLVIDTSPMKSRSIDTRRGILRIGSGVVNSELYEFVGAHGYPFPSGTCPTVAAAGLTQGGGWGYSSRIFGLACDSLLEAALIDGFGRRITASAQNNAAVYWTLRGGGGGNFGVATSLTYRLPPKLFDVTYVHIVYPGAGDETALQFFAIWQQWLQTGERRFTPAGRIYNSEEEGRGIFLRGFFYGTPQQATQALQPFLSIRGAEVRRLQVMTFLEAATLAGSAYPPFERFRFAGRFVLRSLSRNEMQNLIGLIHTRAEGAAYASIALYGLGGRVQEVAPQNTAFFYRNAGYIAGLETIWENPIAQPRNDEWFFPRFQYLQGITCGSYINFPYLGTADYMRAYYGGNAERLRQIKQQYDPCSLFRFPQSIR